jgi:murein DD-endopeptidase MepM/ murein hydrolase activator NlpD
MEPLLNSNTKRFTAPHKIIALTTLLLLCILVYHYATAPVPTEQTLPLPAISLTTEQAPEIANTQGIENTNWQNIITRPGDSLATIFKRMGLSAQLLHTIMNNNPHAKTLTQIKPNQTIKFLIHDTTLEQMVMPRSLTQVLVVQRDDDNIHYTSTLHARETHIEPQTITTTLHHSLYITAKKANIPYRLIQQMTDILAWEINFARDIREGDQFTIHYEAHYLENQFSHTGDVLAVSYTTHGKTYDAIRHQTSDGSIGYFTPEGQSVRKAFTRYPIKFSHISSTFSLSRMHPVLKQRRPHRGVDLAAPIGTPIHATSDGQVTSIGYENGYGNKIKLKHAGPYASVYAHLLKFQKGLSRGAYVKRGDIIGYVGQTGLATGPHCHYEFHVNNHPKNPSTVQLPQAISVPAKELASFKTHAETTLAQLKHVEMINLATTKTSDKPIT